jgi:hypothetical protein
MQERARVRLEKIRHEQSLFEQRRQQLRQAKDMERQREERLYMQLQERKQRALEEERRWRRENVYRGRNPRRRPPPSDAVILSEPPPQPLVGARRSVEGARVTKPVVRPCRHRFRKLPVVGAGRTRIPCLRRSEDFE